MIYQASSPRPCPPEHPDKKVCFSAKKRRRVVILHFLVAVKAERGVNLALGQKKKMASYK